MSKKTLYALMIVMLTFALCISAFAGTFTKAGATNNAVAYTVEAPTSTVEVGDTVTVTVSISESTGFSLASIGVSYDPTCIKFISYEFCAPFTANKCTLALQNEDFLKFSIQSPSLNKNITDTGAFVKVTFEILSTFTSRETEVEVISSGKDLMNGESTPATSDFTVEGDTCFIHLYHFVKFVDAVEPTCVKPGKTAGEVCEICGLVLTGCEEIPATGIHTYVTGNDAVKPTCTGVGYTATETCEVCGATRGHEEIPATGHQHVREDAGVAPTDSSVGYTAGKYCEDCRTWIEGHEEIPKIKGCDHVWVTIPKKEPTCQELGHTEYVQCSICGAYQGIGPTVLHMSHELVVIKAKKATCDVYGLTEGTYCKLCNQIITEQQIIKPTGHTVVSVDGYAPTCTVNGLTDGAFCSVCSAIIVEQVKIEALGHKAVVTGAVDPTCGKDGATGTSYCSVCNEVLVKDSSVIPATGNHTYGDWKVTKAAAPGVEGEQARNCSVCGATETVKIPALPNETTTQQTTSATSSTEPTEKPGLPTGAVIGIGAGALALGGLASFFIFKSKFQH